MSETIRYSRVGKEDINFGKGTFEVRLADGRVMVLNQVDLGALLNDATLSTQDLVLGDLEADNLLVRGELSVFDTLILPTKADPGSPLPGEIWTNASATKLEYADTNTGATHELVGNDVTQTLTNKTLTSPTISSPTLSGTATGTYTLAGTPTITSPTITGAALSGATTIATGATITSPTISNPQFASNVTINGDLTVGSNLSVANGQIQFPAVQNPSSNVNILDDYEEGTWTPSIGGNATYSFQAGSYTKIGRLVTIHAGITINTKGTGSDNTITGLPFTAINGGPNFIGSGWWSGIATAVVNFTPFLAQNSASIVLYANTAANDTLNGAIAIFQNGATVYLSMTYHAA